MLEAEWVGEPPSLPRYNVAPTTVCPVLMRREGRRILACLRWGLVPAWADDPAIGSRMINARAETAPSKPAFRGAFRRRRCLVPALGFYEWKRGTPKRPFWIHAADGSLLTFAGLWEEWRPKEGAPVRTFTVLTADAGPALRPIHDRVPVVVPPEARDAWMDAETPADTLAALLHHAPDDALAADEVSTLVNSPRNDGPELLEPLPPEPTLV